MSLLTYSGDLAHCVNTNNLVVFGLAFVPNLRPPASSLVCESDYIIFLHFQCYNLSSVSLNLYHSHCQHKLYSQYMMQTQL